MTTSIFSAGAERPSPAHGPNGENAPAVVEAAPVALPSAPAQKTAKAIRPFDEDRLESPTMSELQAAERAALLAGDSRRALAYRVLRLRRLRRAQRAAGTTL